MDLYQGLKDVRPFIRESWAMSWPMILIMFFHFSIGITDVFVAGYLGPGVIAAVGYVGQLYFTLMILANGLSVGTVAMVSQAAGARSDEGVGRIGAHSIVLGLLIAGVVTVPARLFPEAIVRAAGMPAEIEQVAVRFLRIYALVLVPTYLSIICGGILRSSGRVRLTMINVGIAAAANVAGCFLLTFGWGPVPAMGYEGIAWASAIATSIGMVLNLWYVCRGPDRIRLEVLLRPVPRCIKNLVRLGVPSAIQQTAWNAGTLVVYFLVGHIAEGEITALAAMTGGLRVEAIIFLPVFAFNMAAAVLTGNRLGAGDAQGARSGAKAAALLCLFIIALPAAVIFAVAPQLSKLLTTDPAVLAEMTRYLRVNMVAVPFMAIGITLSGALQGAGDTLYTMRIVFTGMWLVRIPVIVTVIYAFHFGAWAVWWSMCLSIAVMCALFVRRFRGDAWTTASMDKENNTMLWEACAGDRLSAQQAASRESRLE